MTIVGPWTARQLCLGVGYIFPIYKSSQALQHKDKQQLLQWITFWTVNAIFWVVELVGDTVIGWVPFYFETKIALLLWLVVPQYDGARVLHENWLAPTFEKHEEVIDVAIVDIKRRASECVVQVCKDTAALALRRGSGVVAQGQQYVAAQLVQQALGKLQQPSPPASDSHDLRVPAILSFITAATSAPSDEPCPPKAIVLTKSEAKKDRTEKKTSDAKADKFKQESKEENRQQPDSEAKAPMGLPPTKPRRAPPTLPPPSASPVTPSNGDKSKELVSHFKRLLVKGFQLTNYPSEGVLKHRTLRLLTAQSRYLVFESSKSAGESSSGKSKKSVTVFVHNVRRVASAKASDSGVPKTINHSLAFVLDNGKTTLVFEADSSKTRDLLVAGMRLLVNEHKRQDTVALATITNLFERLTMQRAFDRLIFNREAGL
jgi:receptor expression-enhancing protein 1/2/3/4